MSHEDTRSPTRKFFSAAVGLVLITGCFYLIFAWLYIWKGGVIIIPVVSGVFAFYGFCIFWSDGIKPFIIDPRINK